VSSKLLEKNQMAAQVEPPFDLDYVLDIVKN
jgi:hypothetical protein